MPSVLAFHLPEHFIQRIFFGVSIVGSQVIQVEGVVRSYHIDIVLKVDVIFQVL